MEENGNANGEEQQGEEATGMAMRTRWEREELPASPFAGPLPGAHLLSIPEVLLLLDAQMAKRKTQDPEFAPNPMMESAADYARRTTMNASPSLETIQKMREILIGHHQFTPSEAVAVINLSIGTADEARKLIPTLGSSERFTDEELERILAEVATFRELA
eukprot:scaffold2.g7477.t1